MADRLDVIGTPSDGSSWPLAHQDLMLKADFIIAAKRMQDRLLELGVKAHKLHPYPKPFSALKEALHQNQGRRVIVASGDPLFFGVGNWVKRNYQGASVRFHAAVTSVQAAASILGLQTHTIKTISVHGRPIEHLGLSLNRVGWYAVLTDTINTPFAIACELRKHELDDAHLYVFEHLGSASSNPAWQGSVCELLEQKKAFAPLNLVMIELKSHKRPLFAGMDDCLFDAPCGTSRMLTKSEVRLIVLSKLMQKRTHIGWDIGAGLGGVAIEWGIWSDRLHGSCEIHAIEQNQERFQSLKKNVKRFSVTQKVYPYWGKAPYDCQDWPQPDTIFIGGNQGSLGALLQFSLDRLSAQGTLVAVAVTESSKAQLQQFDQTMSLKAEVTEVRISKGERNTSGNLMLKPKLPVMIYCWQMAQK